VKPTHEYRLRWWRPAHPGGPDVEHVNTYPSLDDAVAAYHKMVTRRRYSGLRLERRPVGPWTSIPVPVPVATTPHIKEG
jgi:hypothetical protein